MIVQTTFHPCASQKRIHLICFTKDLKKKKKEGKGNSNNANVKLIVLQISVNLQRIWSGLYQYSEN